MLLGFILLGLLSIFFCVNGTTYLMDYSYLTLGIDNNYLMVASVCIAKWAVVLGVAGLVYSIGGIVMMKIKADFVDSFSYVMCFIYMILAILMVL